ncbi:winged helix-turn-helix domain-containing protein [Xenophilus azovorans]|uniref:winged helix-turn-helix domain-containing protein n=1 Tax=Xenophilus azovorans TaxID=151755 RepID=UPI001B80A018|nr:winged helix-turn-helix domain-containing protein [Xenophilus azovorans]
MPKTENLSQTYLRFLNLANAIRSLPLFPALDAVEERVLNVLAATWATGAKLTVLEAMQLQVDSSATTVRRRLQTLRQKGLIEFQPDQTDSRIKYVMPTAVAQNYFSKLGRCLDMAARGRLP